MQYLYLLQKVNKKDFHDFENLFNSFLRNNGSLTEISKELFIDKNTVQCQIKKLYKLTGYDLRNVQYFTILHLAFSLAKNCNFFN